MCAWPTAASSCVDAAVAALVAARRGSRAPLRRRAPTCRRSGRARPRRSPAERRVGRLVRPRARAASRSRSASLPRVGVEDARARTASARPATPAAPKRPLHASSTWNSSARRGAASSTSTASRVVLVQALRATRPSSHSVASLFESPEQVDAPPAPLLGHRRAPAEPVRRPQRAEALAELGRPVLERLRLVPRDAVDARPTTSSSSTGRVSRVDERAQPLATSARGARRV